MLRRPGSTRRPIPCTKTNAPWIRPNPPMSRRSTATRKRNVRSPWPTCRRQLPTSRPCSRSSTRCDLCAGSLAGLQAQRRARRIRLAGRAVGDADRSQRPGGPLRPAGGPGQDAEGRRPLQRANSGAGRPPYHRRGEADRHQGRICELARHPRDRRLRSADVLDPGLSGREGAGAAPRHERIRGLAAASMRPAPKPGFWLVARREWRWIRHHHIALILIFGVPLFAVAVLTAVFSHPVIRGLGVVVVDADRSDTSRAFVEQVAASPNLSIVERTGDLASAARAIRAGDAIAAVYIPA